MITKTSHLRCILTIVTCLTVNWTKIYTKLDSSIPKIYTKTGDKGFFSTYTGERRPKEDHVFEALGTTDELSISKRVMSYFTDQLDKIQCVLQDVGYNITTLLSSKSKFSSQPVADLESCLDAFTEELAPLANFILPSVGKSSAALHIARTVCRRAECSISPIVRSGEADPDVATYLNRLSNYLFPVEKIYKRPE
uniref:Cobalamin adenosyltransferase-like domain-containing protein n=1 Tax=Oncorhynchus tshawytscha TaxID=74940 RepID=A0A8C8ME32_ONCTS